MSLHELGVTDGDGLELTKPLHQPTTSATCRPSTSTRPADPRRAVGDSTTCSRDAGGDVDESGPVGTFGYLADGFDWVSWRGGTSSEGGEDGNRWDEMELTMDGRVDPADQPSGPPRADCFDDQPPRLLGPPQLHGRPGATRFGEAENPGPGGEGQRGVRRDGAVAYRDPEQTGFRHTILPDANGGRAASDRDHFALVVDTVNATAWGPTARYLQQTSADLVLCQEHHLGPSEIPAASAWSIRHGWQPILAPAAQGEGGGWRGGVAIFARRHVAIAPPRVGAYELLPARAVAALVEAPGYRPLTAVSVYMEHGQGISEPNLARLEEVGAFLEAQGEHVPFILGGDFQCDPSEVASLGFARRTGSSLVAARDPRGTCRSTTAVTELDFFFVHNSLTAGLSSVRVVEGAGTTPHTPVRLQFHPRLTSARSLVLRRPPPMGTERVFGPLPQPPDWSEVRAQAAVLLAEARKTDFGIDEGFREAYASLYTAWADLAESEVINATTNDVVVSKVGLRGRQPVLVWRSVQAERPPDPPTHHLVLNAWRTIASITYEIRGTLLWLLPAAVRGPLGGHEAADHDQRRVPVPGSAGRDAVPDLIAKLQGIRQQLSRGIDDDGHQAGRRVHHGEGADDDGLPRLADTWRRLHAITCGAELAVREHAAVGREGERRAAAPLTRRLMDATDILHEQVQQRLKQAAAASKAAGQAAWRSWVTENIANGAKHAHQYLRMPSEWRPSTTVTVDGIVTADPRALLASYVAKHDELWNAAHRERQARRQQLDNDVRGERGADDVQRRAAVDLPPWRTARTEPLPRPTPDDLRSTSRLFKANTVVAYDGFALRQYDLLSDQALETVADIMELLERTGELPLQLDLIEMPMIEKSRGGHRAVASLVGLYRLWAKLRKPIVAQWEARNDRPFLAAGKGKSPQAAVWRQACRAEASVGEGRFSASLLWDLFAFFEAVKRVPLWHRAVRLQFPITILRVALTVYGSARMLSLGGALSAPLRAEDGVLAGCGFAMALTRAYVVEPLDAVVSQIGPRTMLPANLDMFVDDVALAAEGTMRQVVARLSNAAELLQEAIEGPLACRIETGKAAVIASSRPLADILRRRFGELAGANVQDARPPARRPRGGGTGRGGGGSRVTAARPIRVKTKRDEPAAPNLGIDFAAGRPRRSHGPRCKRAQRMKKLRSQSFKLARIRALAGKRAPLIFVAGPLPAATYGAAVNGVSDVEALALRRSAALAFTPRARGRSLSRLLHIVGVPTWRAEVEVILEYARQVWQASLLGAVEPTDGTMTLAQLSRLWHAVGTSDLIVDNGRRRNWDAVRGPIGAMHLSLHRVGWAMCGPFTLVNKDGHHVMLTTTTPALLAIMLKQDVTRTLQEQVGEQVACRDERFCGRRAAAEHIAAQLRSDRKLDARDRACFMAVACNAVMTYSRAAAAGYLVEDICPLCGARGDTVLHRIWRCQHPSALAAREAAAPRWLLEEFRRAEGTDNDERWTTALIPHPADVWPGPAAQADMQFEWVGDETPADDDRDDKGSPSLHGSLYVDGSCSTGVFAELRRAATSVVQWSAGKPSGWRLQLPVPQPLPQTPQAAEYCTVALIQRFAHPSKPADVASDCSNVVRDLCAPPKDALSGRRVYAGLLREALTDGAWKGRAVVRKVPAHVNPSAVPEGPRRDDAVGNDLADKLAKATVDLHPAPAPAMVQDLEASLRRAKHIVRVIAKVTQCFPPMPRERMRRPPRAVEGATVAIAGAHRWTFASGLWRCADCLKLTMRPTINGELAHQRCPGSRASLDAAAITARGHTLAKTEAAIPVIFCVRCGTWSARRAYGLSAPCRGKPAPSGKQALARISKGLQPWEDRHEEDGRRRGRGIRCSMMWSADAAAFVPPPHHETARRRGKKRGDAGDAHDGGGTRPRLSEAVLGDAGSGGGDVIDAGGIGHGQGQHQQQQQDGTGDGVDCGYPGELPPTGYESDGVPIGDEDVFGHGGDLDQQEDGDGNNSGNTRKAAADDERHDDGGRRRKAQRLTIGGASGSADFGGYGADDNPGSPGRQAHMDGAGSASGMVGQAALRGVSNGVSAKNVSHTDAIVAREGPGDAEPSSTTGDTTVPLVAAVVTPVAKGEAVATLTSDDHAPQRAGCPTGGGKATCPPDGHAAPSDRDSSAEAVTPHGREQHSSHYKPVADRVGRAHWQVLEPSQTMPSRRGARPRNEGEEEYRDSQREAPPEHGERRRVGDDGPAARALVAWCGTAATSADGLDLEQPQGGWSDRISTGARQHGCPETAFDAAGQGHGASGRPGCSDEARSQPPRGNSAVDADAGNNGGVEPLGLPGAGTGIHRGDELGRGHAGGARRSDGAQQVAHGTAGNVYIMEAYLGRHAERTQRKRAAQASGVAAPSPAERMDAIRRRVTSKVNEISGRVMRNQEDTASADRAPEQATPTATSGSPQRRPSTWRPSGGARESRDDAREARDGAHGREDEGHREQLRADDQQGRAGAGSARERLLARLRHGQDRQMRHRGSPLPRGRPGVARPPEPGGCARHLGSPAPGDGVPSEGPQHHRGGNPGGRRGAGSLAHDASDNIDARSPSPNSRSGIPSSVDCNQSGDGSGARGALLDADHRAAPEQLRRPPSGGRQSGAGSGEGGGREGRGFAGSSAGVAQISRHRFAGGRDEEEPGDERARRLPRGVQIRGRDQSPGPAAPGVLVHDRRQLIEHLRGQRRRGPPAGVNETFIGVGILGDAAGNSKRRRTAAHQGGEAPAAGGRQHVRSTTADQPIGRPPGLRRSVHQGSNGAARDAPGTGHHGAEGNAPHPIRGQDQLPGAWGVEFPCPLQSSEDCNIHPRLQSGDSSAGAGGPPESTAAGHAAELAAWHGRDRDRANAHQLGHAG